MKNSEGDNLLTEEEAAKVLKVNKERMEQWRYKWKNKKKISVPFIPHMKIGRTTYYKKEDILAFLEKVSIKDE
jgi:hypothetical protein